MSVRDTEDKSNRSLLANALESRIDTSTAEGEIALVKLKEYKELIIEMDRLEAERYEIIRKAQEIEWKENKTEEEIKEIKRFRSKVNRLENRINAYDRQLLELEQTEHLKNILKHEKEIEYKKAEQRGKEALAKYREESYKKTREIIKQWENQRKEGNAIRAKLKAQQEAEEKAKIEQSSPSPETQATTPSTNKKKKGTIIEKNLGWILLIALTATTIITMCSLTSEEWFYRLATAPFIVFGNWVIIAGGFKIVETFENHISKTWQSVLLFFISILSVVVFFIYMNR